MERPYRTLTLLMLLILVLVPVACGNKHPEPPAPTATPLESPKNEARAPKAAAPPPPPERVPYEQAFPQDFKSIPPVRIGVLSSPNRPEAGQQFALMLSGMRRRLERKLRKPIKIAFISRSEKRHKPVTQIHFRPEFLHAAIQVAGLMPYKQNVAPMSEAELKREEVDIFVYMGASAR